MFPLLAIRYDFPIFLMLLASFVPYSLKERAVSSLEALRGHFDVRKEFPLMLEENIA